MKLIEYTVNFGKNIESYYTKYHELRDFVSSRNDINKITQTEYDYTDKKWMIVEENDITEVFMSE
jgi:hypothetical protein